MLDPLFGCAVHSLVTVLTKLYWLHSLRLRRRCNFQLVGIFHDGSVDEVTDSRLSGWGKNGITRVWFPKTVLFLQAELLPQFNL